MPKRIVKLCTPERLFLINIILIALILRVYNLSLNPPGLFADEAQIGLYAWKFIAGQPIEGYVNPMYLPAFGFFRPALPSLFSTITVALFGLTEFGTRLASVLVGTFSIIAVYSLTKAMIKHEGPALIAALLTAISPWHIHMSRVSFEGIYLVLLITTGLALLFNKKYFWGTMVMGLGVYAYHPGVMQSTGLFLGILLFVLNKSSWKRKLRMFALFLLMLIPLIHGIITGIASSRMKQVSAFSEGQKSASQVMTTVTNNYLAHFMSGFLFEHGDIGNPEQFITRHSVRGIGEFYAWQAGFIALGFIGLMWQIGRIGQMKHRGHMSLMRRIRYIGRMDSPERTTLFVLIGWLLLYPLGSAVTMSPGPQATRSIIGIVPFEILTGLGIWYVFITIGHLGQKLFTHKKALQTAQGVYIVGITAIIFSALIPYLYSFYVVYPKYSADFWGWQYGAGSVMAYFKKHHAQYDYLYLQPEFNAPHIFLEFYDPRNTCTNCRIGMIQKEYDSTLHQLFAVTPEWFMKTQIPSARIIGSITYPKGAVEFFLVETKPILPKSL